MHRLFGRKGKKKNIAISKKKKAASKNHLIRRHIPTICLVAVGTFLITIGVLYLLSTELESAAARDEYQALREVFLSPPEPQEIAPAADNEEEDEIADEEDEVIEVIEEAVEDLGLLSLAELARLNNDFIGWMSIRNVLEYPVVLGSDNIRYLNTTFTGRRNSAGAIFMDYRNSGGFDEKVSVIYGHNTWDGSMFSPIIRYLDPAFMERNPNIVITTRDGRTLTYRVFAARHTDAWDYAYAIALLQPEWAAEMFYGAPYGASSFMLLSTCTRGGYDEERILVFAAR